MSPHDKSKNTNGKHRINHPQITKNRLSLLIEVVTNDVFCSRIGTCSRGVIPAPVKVLAPRRQISPPASIRPTISRAHVLSVGQEWAMSAALGAWDEARDLVTTRSLTSSSRKLMESLDAVAWRARQLERILEASTVSAPRVVYSSLSVPPCFFLFLRGPGLPVGHTSNVSRFRLRAYG